MLASFVDGILCYQHTDLNFLNVFLSLMFYLFPVKNQGRWVQHFIDNMEQVSCVFY